MKILSLFARPSLKPSWTFTPGDPIWRLYPSRSGELVGEARNQESKRVSFFALNGETGLPFWQDRAFDEPWWIGIEDVTEGVLLLHKFASPDMPQHKGIIGVDLRTGQELWSNAEPIYWFAYKGSVYVHKLMFEKILASELDVKTGHTIEDFGEEHEPRLFQIREEAIQANQVGLEFPEIADLEIVDPRIVGIVNKVLPKGGVHGPLEYGQRNAFLLMSFHTPSKESTEEKTLLDNHFVVIDTVSGRTVYRDTVVRNSPAVVPDSFFIRNGTAFYIKDQKTLTAIRLSQ